MDNLKFKPDFISGGKYRVFDNSEFGSSFIYNDELVPSCYSLNKLKSNSDFKLLRDISLIDMFCGAGIGAVGAKQLGIKVAFAFDNNHHAVRNYNTNIEDKAVLLSAENVDLEKLPYADIITGGFPCQPFSVSGKGLGEKDPEKGSLGLTACEIISKVKPQAFMLENVKGLTHKKNKNFFNSLIEFLSCDYNVTYDVIDCSDYGVPQKRERVFIVGVRKDLIKKFEFPAKTHKIKKYPSKMLLAI